MIGPQLRKGLRWAAVVYMLFGPIVSASRFYQMVTAPNFEVMGSQFDLWTAFLLGIATTVVQGGVLLVLLSIDERLERKGQA
jgi:hypothetical protein